MCRLLQLWLIKDPQSTDDLWAPGTSVSYMREPSHKVKQRINGYTIKLKQAE